MTIIPDLVDHTGKPLGARPSDDPHLPAGVQALIETRVEAAIGCIREHNRDDLQDLSRDHIKKWRWIAYVSMFLTILSAILASVAWFVAPAHVAGWITKQVDTKLTEPLLIESADRVISSKMGEYVDVALAPLRDSTEMLQQTVDTIKMDIEKEQANLAREQHEISEKLHIQEWSIAAKAGSRAAYEELIKAMHSPDHQSDLLRAVLREIELFYDADRNQLSFVTLGEATTLKDPGFSTDEVIFVLRTQPPLAEAAVNTLSRLKGKATVGELCKLALDGHDLRVAARATRALQEITGEKFRPLEFDKVRVWWDANQTNEIYRGEYDNYVNTIRAMRIGSILSQSDVGRHVDSLRQTSDSDPDALHARCMMAGLLLISGQNDQAKSLLEEVRAKRNDYAWLHFWDAAWHIVNDQLDEGAKALNKVFVKYPGPTFEIYVRMYNIFRPILEHEDIKWPRRNN